MDIAFLKKYNALPKELRDKINNPAVVSRVEKIEQKYGVTLAEMIMKVMTKDILIGDLENYIIMEKKLDEAKAGNIAKDLRDGIFAAVTDYLNSGNANVKAEKKAVSIASPSTSRSEKAASPKAGNAETENHVVRYEDHLPVRKSAKSIVEKLEEKVEEDIAKEEKKEAEEVLQERAKSRGSKFFFSAEDEEEIRNHAKKTEQAVQIPQPLSIDEQVDNLIKEVKLNFASGFLVDRFKQVLKTYLKGIRDAVDTKAALKRAIDAGGLGFEEETAAKVIMTAGKYKVASSKPAMAQPKKIAVPEDAIVSAGADKKSQGVGVGLRDAPYDLSGLSKKEPVPAENKEVKANPIRPVAVPPKESPTASEPVVTKVNVRTVLESSGKKKMDDIKFGPTLGVRQESHAVTPIDELRMMDLTTFRRMGQQDPFRAVSRIKEKIKLLEEEDYNKKVEGIKAWRMSPVNKIYLEIGGQSIAQGKPVDIVTAEMQFAGKEIITNLEFEAIMDLNKELRF